MRSEQRELNFTTSLHIAEKKSLADYTAEEQERYEKLILEARTNRVKLSLELQHYLRLKEGASN